MWVGYYYRECFNSNNILIVSWPNGKESSKIRVEESKQKTKHFRQSYIGKLRFQPVLVKFRINWAWGRTAADDSIVKSRNLAD